MLINPSHHRLFLHLQPSRAILYYQTFTFSLIPPRTQDPGFGYACNSTLTDYKTCAKHYEQGDYHDILLQVN